VLNRLWEEKKAPTLTEVRRAEAVLAPVARRSPSERHARLRAPAPQSIRLVKPKPATVEPRCVPQSGSFRELLHQLQRLRSSGATRCVVLAAATEAEDIAALATDTATRAAERALRVETVRVASALDDDATRGEMEQLCLDVSRSDWQTRLATWQATMASDTVALLLAAPLSSSSDAAQIATGCDGLIVLVELGRTPSQGLAAAIKRARDAGCPLLGLIVIGSDGLPAWGRRLLQSMGEIHVSEC
jgi:hypothetical protein